MNHTIMIPVFSSYGLQSLQSLQSLGLCNVRPHLLIPFMRSKTIIDYIEEFDETTFVRACLFMILIMYLSYLVSDKTVEDEVLSDESDEVLSNESDEVLSNESDEVLSNESDEVLSNESDETPASDELEEDLLRFYNTDTKFDQAANILAYIYSCGLTLPGLTFPLESWSIQNKRIKIKEVSFMRKVKKYQEAPSENMRMLILSKPTLRQLMEAYTYYSNLEGRSMS